jgi:hypothetical protein
VFLSLFRRLSRRNVECEFRWRRFGFGRPAWRYFGLGCFWGAGNLFVSSANESASCGPAIGTGEIFQRTVDHGFGWCTGGIGCGVNSARGDLVWVGLGDLGAKDFGAKARARESRAPTTFTPGGSGSGKLGLGSPIGRWRCRGRAGLVVVTRRPSEILMRAMGITLEMLTSS